MIIEGASDSDAVTVQVMNADGTFGAQASWLNAYGEYPAGWFTDDTGAKDSDITLKPGEAVYLYSTATGAKIKIPSAL